MMWIRSVLTLVWVCLACDLLAVQELPAENPFRDDPAAVQAGMGLYRIRCADCHGVDGRGVRGPGLTGVWASGRTDPGLYRTIVDGVPGTEMRPITRTRDEEVWKILAYLRTLATPPSTEPPRGDAGNGERLFRENCAACHRVNAVGGRLGPDLSRIGSSRSREALVKGIREGFEPRSDSGYAPVMLTTGNGRSVRGVTKNEDLFSIQIMEAEGRIQGFDKEGLQELEKPNESVMPVFGPDRLSDGELDDVVRYLETLRGFDPAVP